MRHFDNGASPTADVRLLGESEIQAVSGGMDARGNPDGTDILSGLLAFAVGVALWGWLSDLF